MSATTRQGDMARDDIFVINKRRSLWRKAGHRGVLLALGGVELKEMAGFWRASSPGAEIAWKPSFNAAQQICGNQATVWPWPLRF